MSVCTKRRKYVRRTPQRSIFPPEVTDSLSRNAILGHKKGSLLLSERVILNKTQAPKFQTSPGQTHGMLLQNLSPSGLS